MAQVKPRKPQRPHLTRLEEFIVDTFQRGMCIEDIVNSYADIDRDAVNRALRRAGYI